MSGEAGSFFIMKLSAGTVLYRQRPDGEYEMLLVHPSGNYNKKAKWSLPKGTIDPDETAEQAARRETLEECAVVAPSSLIPLGDVLYASRKKRVLAFAGKVSFDINPICNSWEIDQAEFLTLEKAEQLIHPCQKAFIKRLREIL